jgi:hypothetical protein
VRLQGAGRGSVADRCKIHATSRLRHRLNDWAGLTNGSWTTFGPIPGSPSIDKALKNQVIAWVFGPNKTVESGILCDEHLEVYAISQEWVRRETLQSTFSRLGGTSAVTIGSSSNGEDDISASTALRLGTEAVLSHVIDQTDIILDVSSLPRVVCSAHQSAQQTGTG